MPIFISEAIQLLMGIYLVGYAKQIAPKQPFNFLKNYRRIITLGYILILCGVLGAILKLYEKKPTIKIYKEKPLHLQPK